MTYNSLHQIVVIKHKVFIQKRHEAFRGTSLHYQVKQQNNSKSWFHHIYQKNSK